MGLAAKLARLEPSLNCFSKAEMFDQWWAACEEAGRLGYNGGEDRCQICEIRGHTQCCRAVKMGEGRGRPHTECHSPLPLVLLLSIVFYCVLLQSAWPTLCILTEVTVNYIWLLVSWSMSPTCLLRYLFFFDTIRQVLYCTILCRLSKGLRLSCWFCSTLWNCSGMDWTVECSSAS